MAKSPKPYYEESTGKYICKRRETYKGITWNCTGASRKNGTEARKAWQLNYEKKIAEIDYKGDLKCGRIKLCKALPEWYDLYKRNEIGKGGRARSQRTINTDLDTIKQIISALGNLRVSDIDSDIIQKYMKTISEQNSQSTVNKRWNMLSMYFKYMYPDGHNPMIRCVRPESTQHTTSISIFDDDEPTDKRAYTDEEMCKLAAELIKPYDVHSKLYSESRGYSVGLPLIICMYQFLRVGELVELRVKDIDFDNNFIHIRRQYDEKNKLIVPPKYGSKRKVPIMAECRPILQACCSGKESNALLFEAGHIYNPEHLKHDGHILRGRLRDNLNNACERLSLERHTIHDLRHDGISRIVRLLKDDPYSVQKWAGHKSLSITLDQYYRHTGQDNMISMEKVTGIEFSASL